MAVTILYFLYLMAIFSTILSPLSVIMLTGNFSISAVSFSICMLSSFCDRLAESNL